MGCDALPSSLRLSSVNKMGSVIQGTSITGFFSPPVLLLTFILGCTNFSSFSLKKKIFPMLITSLQDIRHVILYKRK